MRFFEHPSQRVVAPHERVYSYLESRLTDFDYRAGTYTAAEALRRREGNCLTLAIVTRALAGLAGVDVGYLLVDSPPVYQMVGRTVLVGQHVRVALFAPPDLVRPLLRGRIIVDYFPDPHDRVGRVVDEAEFVGMYHRNVAAEQMAAGELVSAYRSVRRAMAIEPANEHNVNMLALLHARAGFRAEAEAWFLYGLETARDEQYLLENYQAMLVQDGRHEDAARLEPRLEPYDAVNPFRWVLRGNEAFAYGDYVEAIACYRTADRIAPYLHEAQAALAGVYYAQGELDAAKQAMHTAAERARGSNVEARYRTKMRVLDEMLGH